MKKIIKMKQWLDERNKKIDVLSHKYAELNFIKEHNLKTASELKNVKQELNALLLHKKMQRLFEVNNPPDEAQSLENIFETIEESLIDLVVDSLNYCAKRRGKIEKEKKDVAPPKQIDKDMKQIKKSIEIIYKYCDVYDGYGGFNLKSNSGAFGALSFLRGMTQDADSVRKIFSARRFNTEKLATLHLEYIDHSAISSLLFARREDQIEVELRGIINFIKEMGVSRFSEIENDLKIILQYIHPKKKTYISPKKSK